MDLIIDCFAGLVIGKSSLSKEGITTESLIDSGYTGSIHVVLFNHSRKLRVFEKGDKIAQIMFVRIVAPTFVQVDQITGGDRGDRGFGSTGK